MDTMITMETGIRPVMALPGLSTLQKLPCSWLAARVYCGSTLMICNVISNWSCESPFHICCFLSHRHSVVPLAAQSAWIFLQIGLAACDPPLRYVVDGKAITFQGHPEKLKISNLQRRKCGFEDFSGSFPLSQLPYLPCLCISASS